MTKLQKIAALVGAGGIFSAISAFAATLSPIPVPTSTAPDALAFVGGQLTDPGTYVILLLVIGVPLAFYVAKKVIGLIPKR